MGKKKEAEDVGDLRKEVEMDEHHNSFEQVAKQYGVSLTAGLTSAKVLEVTIMSKS